MLQLAASFNENIDFGPKSNGSNFVKVEGNLVHGLRLRELPDFCAEHILHFPKLCESWKMEMGNRP